MIKSFIPAAGYWAIVKSSSDQSMWAYPLLGFALEVMDGEHSDIKYADIVPVSCEMASGHPGSRYGCMIMPDECRENMMVVHETQCGNVERMLIEAAKMTETKYPFVHAYEGIKRKNQ